MSLSVWKFEIQVVDKFVIEMPKDARILHVAVQNETPQLWALCDPTNERVQRKFYVRGTGVQIEHGFTYLGSFMLYGGAFVGHLFEPARKAR